MVADDEQPLQVAVARIGAPHGLRGMVRLELRTDNPGGRLAPGAELDAGEHGRLTVAHSEERSGAWYVRFAEADDRTAVEGLRGAWLLAAPDDDEDEAWYRHQLVGLRAEDPAGAPLGTVSDLQHLPAQDVLEITEPRGSRSLVPFVTEIVTDVDVPGGRVVIDAPTGLLAETPPAGGPEPDGAP